MSIVEKALERVYRSAPPPEAVRTERQASSRITIDRRALAQQGLLPQIVEQTRVSDEFRRLKWPLLEPVMTARETRRTNRSNLWLITSAVPAEGKTFVATTLALNVAQEIGWEVILVDGDVARRKISRAFGVQDRQGLVNMLTQPELRIEDVLVATDIPNLFLLPAGHSTDRLPELLASARMSELMEQFERDMSRGTIFVFDSAPTLATNEAQVLVRHVGQVVFVIRADHTPQNLVKEAVGLLGEKTRISVALNQVSRSPFAGYYGEYYGYGESNG
jgi:protein-tyrosine kinase